MKYALAEITCILLSRRPAHLAFTPHHILSPFTHVCSASCPSFLALAPHVAFVKLTDIFTAITPYVVAFPVHTAVEPRTHVGITIRKYSLVLDKAIGGGGTSRGSYLARSGSEIEPCELLVDEILSVDCVVLATDMFIWKPYWHLSWTIP